MVKIREASKAFLSYLYMGVQHSFRDIGVKSVGELREGANEGSVRFEVRMASGLHNIGYLSFATDTFKGRNETAN